MLTFRQFSVGCHVTNIAVKLIRGFHFHRSTRLSTVKTFHTSYIDTAMIDPKLLY